MSTDRKEKILFAALELFAMEGYHATSTSKIAKKAGVSEGLIFRHYEHKEGLLRAILQAAESLLRRHVGPILDEVVPEKVIRMYIEMPFQVPEDEYNFWRLQFKLKWEANYPKLELVSPLLDKLTWAFDVLDYHNPALEAQVLYQTIEGISTAILRDGIGQSNTIQKFLLEKYNV